MKLHKQAKDKVSGAVWAILVIALIVVLHSTEVIDLGAVVGSPRADSGDTPPTPQGGVTSVTPTFTVNCVDLHSPQTSVSCNAKYRIDDGAIQYDTDASAIAANVGESVEWIVNGSNYYHEQGKFVMPDKNTHSITARLLNFDTNPTIQVFNQDDGLLNSASDTEALAANNIDTLTVKIFSSFKDGIRGATFVTDYLRTNIDDITSSLGSDVQEPDSLTHNSTGGATNADTFRSFRISDCLNCDPSTTNAQNVEFTISVDVGSSAYGIENITTGLIDEDWFPDSTGGFSFGYEEPQDNVDVGQKHHLFDDYIKTAST